MEDALVLDAPLADAPPASRDAPPTDAAVASCGSLDLEAYRSADCFCGAACECFLDIPYGLVTWREGGVDRAQALDLYLPVARSAPMPLVFWAHPNGSTKAIGAGGALATDLAIPLLGDGTAFASLEFRHPAVNADIGAPRTDIASAIQFLRCNDEVIGIDSPRMAAIGRSRGTLSIWTALQDDLADGTSPDPMARESTRLRGVYAIQAQTSYWGEWIADAFFSSGSRAAVIALLGSENYGHAVGDVTADDPPVVISYGSRLQTLPLEPTDCDTLGGPVDCVHLPNFADELCRSYERAGIGDRCAANYGVPGPNLYAPGLPLLRSWIAP